uniref:hypothetical protein n=1 Tax=Acidocella sp. C78 TaxID=1671486 RepID=UPI00191BBE02|nr:hypothetical protein [Acidocella sp. C78]
MPPCEFPDGLRRVAGRCLPDPGKGLRTILIGDGAVSREADPVSSVPSFFWHRATRDDFLLDKSEQIPCQKAGGMVMRTNAADIGKCRRNAATHNVKEIYICK